MFIQRPITNNTPARQYRQNVHFGNSMPPAANTQVYVTKISTSQEPRELEKYRSVKDYLDSLKGTNEERINAAKGALGRQYDNNPAFPTNQFIIADVTTTLYSPKMKSPISATTFYIDTGKEADSWYKQHIQNKTFKTFSSRQSLIDKAWRDFHIGIPGSSTSSSTITVDDLTLDFLKKEVTVNSNKIRLGRIANALLRYLMEHAGQVKTYAEIESVFLKIHSVLYLCVG